MRFCDDKERTLNIHHLHYNGEPWEADDRHLITLCEYCHEDVTKQEKEYKPLLIQSIKQAGFMGDDLRELALAFHNISVGEHNSSLVAEAIRYAINQNFDQLISNYIKKVKGGKRG